MLGGIGGRRRRGWKRMRWLDGITDSMDWVWVNSESWWWTGRPGVLQFMGSQRVGHYWMTELNWTECTDVSQTIKKAEHQRTDVLELWCWRRLLKFPWTSGRSNQSILKEINPEYSFEGLMVKLKLQYFGHLMWRADSLGNTLFLGKIEGMRRRGQQKIDGWMASLTQWTWVWTNSGHSEGQGNLACCSPWNPRVRQDWVPEQQQYVKLYPFVDR